MEKIKFVGQIIGENIPTIQTTELVKQAVLAGMDLSQVQEKNFAFHIDHNFEEETFQTVDIQLLSEGYECSSEMVQLVSMIAEKIQELQTGEEISILQTGLLRLLLPMFKKMVIKEEMVTIKEYNPIKKGFEVGSRPVVQHFFLETDREELIRIQQQIQQKGMHWQKPIVFEEQPTPQHSFSFFH